MDCAPDVLKKGGSDTAPILGELAEQLLTYLEELASFVAKEKINKEEEGRQRRSVRSLPSFDLISGMGELFSGMRRARRVLANLQNVNLYFPGYCNQKQY